MINPLTRDYSSKVMDLALQVQDLSGEPDIDSLGSTLVLLLGAVALLRQEVPESRFECEKMVGELRAIVLEYYPNVLEAYLHRYLTQGMENDQDAVVISLAGRRLATVRSTKVPKID